MSDVNDMLAEWCTEFIDWPKRRSGEQDFFIDLLRSFGCEDIFESSLGDGYNTVRLLEAGFSVSPNEIDPEFLKQGIENILAHGFPAPKITAYDWRAIPDSLSDSFDAALMLGNSLTYMMTRGEQELVVKNLAKVVKSGSPVVVDHRNYDYMLRHRDEILADPRKYFRYSKRFYYCGECIDCYPVEIEDTHVTLEYYHRIKDKKGHLNLFPLKRQEVVEIMRSAGLRSVKCYGNFQLNRVDDAGEVDFYQHVGIKREL